MVPHRAERAFAGKKERDIKGKMLTKKGKMIKKSEADSRIEKGKAFEALGGKFGEKGKSEMGRRIAYRQAIKSMKDKPESSMKKGGEERMESSGLKMQEQAKQFISQGHLD